MNAQQRSSTLAADVNNLFVDIPSRMTTREFFAFTQHTERQFQLLNGRPLMNPAPLIKHQMTIGNLYMALNQFVQTNRLGMVLLAPCDVVLDRFNVVQPDLFLITPERSHLVTEKNVQGAPDLVVEILSATTADLDRGYKQHLYAVHGVRECWLIDPDALRIEVLTLIEGLYGAAGIYGRVEVLRSPLLSGLQIAVNDIFSGV